MSSRASFIGRQIDEYRLEALLGEGGMASVYRALDARLNRYVAVKVIQTSFRSDSNYVVRFEREAQAIAQLEHPNIITLYRFGDKDGLLYLAMQYIDGADLGAVIDSFRRDNAFIEYKDIIRIAHEVGAALDYAHSRGVIHRDIKPHNIMINSDGRAIITDFGLVLMTALGTQGEIFGSPHYIAPEQAISSARVVPQSDLYAFAVVIYEMLTNTVPFTASEPLDIAMMHMSDPVPSPRNARPELPQAVEDTLFRALAKTPEERFGTGNELAVALEAALQEQPAAPIVKHATVAERVALQVDANPLPPIPAGTARTTEPHEVPQTAPALQLFLSQTLFHKQRSRWALLAIAGIGVVILLVLLSVYMNNTSTYIEIEPTLPAIAAATDEPDATSTETPAPTDTFTPTDTSTPTDTLVPTHTPAQPTSSQERVLRLLTNGHGLTTGRQMINGEIEVEGYCSILDARYSVDVDDVNWYCTQNGQRIVTLTDENLNEICRLTYNNPDATAIQLAGSQPAVYRWRCFGPDVASSAAAPSVTNYTIVINWFGEDSLFVLNDSSVDFPLNALTLHGGGQVRGTEWGIDRLGSGECVAVWKDTGNPRAANSSCTLVGTRIVRDGPNRFWKSSFTVIYNDVEITTCEGTPCTVQIPG